MITLCKTQAFPEHVPILLTVPGAPSGLGAAETTGALPQLGADLKEQWPRNTFTTTPLGKPGGANLQPTAQRAGTHASHVLGHRDSEHAVGTWYMLQGHRTLQRHNGVTQDMAQ